MALKGDISAETESHSSEIEVSYEGKRIRSRGTQTSEKYPPATCLTRCSNTIIWSLETFFYKLGLLVARYPWLTIILSIGICGLCGIGLTRFKNTTDDSKLWVPQDSRVLPEKKWSEKMFPEQTRFTSFIVEASNVLSPWAVNAMYDLYEKSKGFQLQDSVSLEDMCLKVGPHCHVSSILEIWSFNKTVIKNLSINKIVKDINTKIQYSPMYRTEFDLDKMLSGKRYDNEGRLIGAGAVIMHWVLKKNVEHTAAALEWEKLMIDMANNWKENVRHVYVYATRSFDDEGYGAVNADTSLLTAGFIIVFIYIILVLGRFNLVEHKLYLSLAGILSIGLAIVFCYGLAMMTGLIYGPIHALMPFLLLGIGVDDMFVIVEAYQNLNYKEKTKPLEVRIATALKHAGVSITVTSVTDVVTFGIGGSTVIPALSAFCGYASLGIIGLYCLVSTFFVACLTIDQMRIDQHRDALFLCYVHKNYTPNKFSRHNYMSTFIEKYYAPFLMKFPVKVCVILVVIAVAAVNVWSFTKLRQDFDLFNYIPDDSYAKDYVHAQIRFYPDIGSKVAVYCDGMNYYHNSAKLKKMIRKIERSPYVKKNSVDFWFMSFLRWLKSTSDPWVLARIDEDKSPKTGVHFDQLLLYYIEQPEGRSYQRLLRFSHTLPLRVIASKIPVLHTKQPNATRNIAAMENLRSILDSAGFPDGRCFCYGFNYLNNETNKVLQGELYRNLIFAAISVFLVTLLLIANLWTSILVFTCVVFTVIDVAGTLQFWGVTIDTASSILIILCVGLAVDYSAHVGHTFMTLAGHREERAKATLKVIGPAVLGGGFSTFLAFVLLANSTSYGFMLFFRVFMSVVVFGLFHGLVYLPVLLSWVGPEPYQSAEPVHSTSNQGRQSTTEHSVKYQDGDVSSNLIHSNGFSTDAAV